MGLVHAGRPDGDRIHDTANPLEVGTRGNPIMVFLQLDVRVFALGPDETVALA